MERQFGDVLPRKKFNRDEASRIWTAYTKNLVDSISDSEKEGHEKGYSSYEIEMLWQNKMKLSAEKSKLKENDPSSHESK